MTTFKDLTGHRFGKLTCISLSRFDKGAIWLMRCDCGERVTRTRKQLWGKNALSCDRCKAELLKSKYTKLARNIVNRKFIIATKGKFELTPEIYTRLASKGYNLKAFDNLDDLDIRCNTDLHYLVALCKNTLKCKVKLVEVDSDAELVLMKKGGREYIAEKHRTWN